MLKPSISRAQRYPHFDGSELMDLKAFIHRFDALTSPGAVLAGPEVLVAGRIYSYRESGKNLRFYDIRQDNHELQIVSNRQRMDESFDRLNSSEMKIADVAAFRGLPGRTRSGQLSLFSSNAQLLAPSMHDIPYRPGIKAPHIRYRQRYLDMLSNPPVLELFKKRSQVLCIVSLIAPADFHDIDHPIHSRVSHEA